MGKSVRFHTRYKRLRIASVLSLVLILGTFCVFFLLRIVSGSSVDTQKASEMLTGLGKGKIEDDLIQINKYSRPGIKLAKVNGIVVHYTANPGTDAKANRNYFNNLPVINEQKDKKTYASSNFIIGIEGQILRVVPETEMAYASNERNKDTLSIECCYKRKNGAFTRETRESLLWLITSICKAYNLTEEDVIRHYDVTGKLCPLYYVKHEDKWIEFKQKIAKKLKE